MELLITGPTASRTVIAAVATDLFGGGADRMAVGGRSMGGRIASLVADKCGVGARVYYG